MFRFLVEIITNSDDLRLKIFRPVTKFDVVVVLLSVVGPHAVENLQRAFHVVVEVFTHKVIESLDPIVEDSHIVDGSEINSLIFIS